MTDQRIAIVAFGMEHCMRGVEAHAQMLFDELSKESKLDVYLIKGSGPQNQKHVTLSVLKRDSIVNRILGRLRGYNIYWEQVFFMVRLGVHLLRKRNFYTAIYTQEYVHLVGMGKLKTWFGLKFKLVYCEGFVISRPTRLKYADSLQEINKKNYTELSAQAEAQGKKMRLIPHFYKAEKFEMSASERTVKREVMDFKADRRLILFVGSTEREEKNFDYIRDEFKILDASWCLLICGECSPATLKSLQSEFPNRVMHLYQRHLFMQEVYPLADFFLLPALDEPFGISIIEAMHFARPMILHDTAHSRWVSNDPDQCINMTVKGSLDEHFKTISDLSDYILTKGAQNKAFFNTNYTWEQLRPAYLEVLS